jgi:hypothetical protein
MRELIARLLFDDQVAIDWSNPTPATLSVPAIQAFVRGQAAISMWELRGAEIDFLEATSHDPAYSEASLWLALTRSWIDPKSTARWLGDAERAANGRERLSSLDGERAEALAIQARGEYARACPRWQRLAEANQSSFADWYSYATCLFTDSAVLVDSQSPTGRRFRTSYTDAYEAYQRAFQLLPSVHRMLRPAEYDALRDLLFTSRTQLRPGAGLEADTTQYVAYASLAQDELVFWPFPRNDIALWVPSIDPASIDRAVQRQRRLFLDIATGWAAVFPDSASAVAAVAVGLDLMGNPTAIDTLVRARQLAKAVDEQRRLAWSEVLLRLRWSTPTDTVGLLAARLLADSLLGKPNSLPDFTEQETARALANLAALTGRAAAAARYQRVALSSAMPAPLAWSGADILTHAAMGGPADVLKGLESEVEIVLFDSRNLRIAPLAWLHYPAVLSLPVHRFRVLATDSPNSWLLLEAASAFARGDVARVREKLDDIDQTRALTLVGPADMTFDAVLIEAWLLDQIGSPEEAIDRLEGPLHALRQVPANRFDVMRVGPMIRSMALLADLHRRRGNGARAATWARAVQILWSDADPFLTPVIRDMQEIIDAVASVTNPVARNSK